MSNLISQYFPDATILKRFVGNEGTVYVLDNSIAVKILDRSHWASLESIKNEVIIQEAAHKLGIAPKVYFYHEKEGLMASEYIEGLTLDEYLDTLDTLTLEEMTGKIFDLQIKIKETLNIMYDNGITHGDLAGSNIIIDKYGKIQLIDFSSGSIEPGPILNSRDYYITGKMENYYSDD